MNAPQLGLTAIAVTTVITITGSALAQSGPPTEPAEPPVEASSVEGDTASFPSTRVAKSGRVHDGFYLRMGIGGGYVHDAIDTGLYDVEIRGSTIPIEVLVGGSPIPGLAIGGGIWADPLVDPEVEAQGITADVPSGYHVQYSRLGLFVDGYPNPKLGGHIMGGVALAAMSISDDSDDDDLVANARGPACMLGGGYEWWVGREWSIGVLGEFSYARLSVDDETHELKSFSILSSFTFH